MNLFTILLIAFGLSMDAFAVAISTGVTTKNIRFSQALQLALFFGGFQAIMPVIGWLAGTGLKNYITGIDHWLAFVILFFIGIKMIYESFRMKESEESGTFLKLYTLFLLAIATSIDALAIGTTFALLNVTIIAPVVIIGLVTFAFSLSGVYIGDRFGHVFENKIEIAGGICLIAIGLKILIEHLL